MIGKIFKTVVSIILIVVLVFLLIGRIGNPFKIFNNKRTFTGNSTLINRNYIKELQVSSFKYGGVAFYFDKEKDNIVYHDNESGKKADLKIKYVASVNAFVNEEELNKIEETKKIENKIIYLKKPVVSYSVEVNMNTRNEKDKKKFDTIGTMKSEYKLDDLEKACKIDAETEIKNNYEVSNNIQKYAQNVIESLYILPELNFDYKIEWVNGD